MSTALELLPTHGNASEWNEQEIALMEAAGLVQRRGDTWNAAPRATAEAFLMHCRRSGLDPIARQIYCIERGGKYTTQVSIDGMRLVAQRSGQYAGQAPTQWTADGVTWTDVWLAEGNPAAARVGVHRAGFAEPLYAVATWREYAIPNGNMWKKMPALMLGKVAEALALRKAFPQDLSGLYSAEEMDQAGPAPVEATVERVPSAPAVEPVAAEVSREAVDEVSNALLAATSEEDVVAAQGLAQQRGLAAGSVIDADGTTLVALFKEARARLARIAAETAVAAPVEGEGEAAVLEGMER